MKKTLMSLAILTTLLAALLLPPVISNESNVKPYNIFEEEVVN